MVAKILNDIQRVYRSISLRGFCPDEGSAYIDIHDNVILEIGNKLWFMTWKYTTHYMKVYNNFTSSPHLLNNGTNITFDNNKIIQNGQWPEVALKIMAESGIDERYREIKWKKCACSLSKQVINEEKENIY